VGGLLLKGGEGRGEEGEKRGEGGNSFFALGKKRKVGAYVAHI